MSETTEEEIDHGSRPMPKSVRAGMIKVSGKDYLPVPFRLLWMRETVPLWGISTQILEVAGFVLVRATVTDETGRVISSAHKACTSGGKFPPVEKAETGAMGRALGAAGFGTQFGELNEEEPGVMGGIADSPIDRGGNQRPANVNRHTGEVQRPPAPDYPPAPTTVAEAIRQFRLILNDIVPQLAHLETKNRTLAEMVKAINEDGSQVDLVAKNIPSWIYAIEILRRFHERIPSVEPKFLLDAVHARFKTDLPATGWTALMWETIFTEEV